MRNKSVSVVMPRCAATREKRISSVSLMSNGLADGMALQDFADNIAYLEARRDIGEQKN